MTVIVGGTGVHETERHDCQGKLPVEVPKSNFFYALGVHLDLIIATETICKGEHGMASNVVD